MKRLLTVCLCVMLVTTLIMPETVFAARTTVSQKSVGSAARTGWYTQKNGKKKYYRDGQYVTGQQKETLRLIKSSIISNQMDMYQDGKRAGNIIQPRENV